MYCVYLTSYKGNKLPMFYVGSTSLVNIAKGYRGSVAGVSFRKLWKTELKEHPDLFKTKVLTKTFVSRQEAYDVEDRLLRALNAVSSNLYINQRCAKGLGFHPTGENSPRYKVTHTVEARKKISEAHKGKSISPKHRNQISIFHSGKPKSPAQRIKMSEAAKKWIRTEEIKSKMSISAKKRKASSESKMKRSEATKKCKWWSDGENTRFCQDQPGENFIRGRSKQ